MRTWNTLPGERTLLFSPAGIRPIDEFTGLAPLGRVAALLERSDGAGGWGPTDIKPVTTPSGVLTYPHLGRRAEVVGQPPRRYRVKLSADFYIPLYRIAVDGLEFDAHPYNDTNPPNSFPLLPQDALLTPSPNYPFPTHIRVLRGVVEDTAGLTVGDAMVSRGIQERVLTDARGTFALPLRWPDFDGPVQIDAEDKLGRVGSINVQLPDALLLSQTIPIT